MSTRPETKKIHIKRKRNTNPDTSYFSFSPVYYKLIKTNKNPQKSIKFFRNNSQPYLRNKSIVVKSIDINVDPSKLMTPQNQNRIILKDIFNSPYSANRKPFDNKSIFLSITSKIERIMINFSKSTLKLNYLLTKIENYINKIIRETTENINKTISDYDNNKDNNKVISLKNNFIKYDDNNKNKIKNNSSNEEKCESENKLLKKKINKLYQKINEMEIKFKIDELNYFFCIGENQKKINELENKLNMKNIDKMPKEELKKFLCYPHYVKFDVKEDINPKSIPMFTLRKTKCKTSKNRHKNNKITYTGSDDNVLANYFKKSVDNNNDNNLDIIDIIKKSNKDIEEKFLSDKGIEINEIKDTIKLGIKQYERQIPIVDQFFGKKKSFFVSHPKLNYIKVGKDGKQLTSWKIDNQLNNLPQQISKLKISKSQKNAMIVFPSSFNETMVNLEKLRTNKNFKSIENKFEENLKLNKKYIKNDK